MLTRRVSIWRFWQFNCLSSIILVAKIYKSLQNIQIFSTFFYDANKKFAFTHEIATIPRKNFNPLFLKLI
jgi:hypothetical protein